MPSSINTTTYDYFKKPLTKKEIESFKTTIQKAKNFEAKISLIVILCSIAFLLTLGLYLFSINQPVIGIALPILLGVAFVPIILFSVSDYVVKKHSIFVYIDGKNYLIDLHDKSIEDSFIEDETLLSDNAAALHKYIIAQERQILGFEKLIIQKLSQ